jgi:hypothetical protein
MTCPVFLSLNPEIEKKRITLTGNEFREVRAK